MNEGIFTSLKQLFRECFRQDAESIAPMPVSGSNRHYFRITGNGVDAVSYSYYTTIEGVMEKEDPTNPEFEVPVRLKELYKAKNYGQYANEKGELVTCFITDNDITGGNSGSPVINANGELIGLAFDGNSEAMSGDIDFEENLQRCICVDVRYVLFTIDVYAGATNLIKEMNIVK